MLSHVIRELLLPPGSLLLLALAALIGRKRAPRVALGLAVTSASLLYLLSLPSVDIALSNLSYREPVLTQAAIDTFKPQAIVILGGGAEVQAPEYGGLTVPSESTLKRTEYGAYLAKKTGLPILVTGGYGRTPEESEASAMSFALRLDGLTPQWVESQGRNTRENAGLSGALLAKDNVERVLLVSGASHTHRARISFETARLQVLAAPTGFRALGSWDRGLMAVVPSSRHFLGSSDALRALLAEAWYALTGS